MNNVLGGSTSAGRCATRSASPTKPWGAHRTRNAPRTDRFFNDIDQTNAALRRWTGTSLGVMRSLHHERDASSLERGMWSALDFVQSGVAELERLIEDRPPAEVADWLPEMGARFQNVDDTCLAAARS